MPAILVNDVSPVISYVATAAQTLFAVPFEFFDVGDIVVERAGVELVYSPTPANNNQYSVVGANVEGGGSITLGSPGATLGETIVIYRDVPIERLANYPETGPMAVRSLNAEQAKHIAMMQQLERDVNRSVTVPIGESSIDLPSAAERADKILTFDENGVPSTEFDIGLLTGAVISSGAAPAQTIEFTATAGQTVFNFLVAAIPTFVSVFLNGVKLPSTDFTHSGTTVTLLTPATVGDRVALEGFTQSAILEALVALAASNGSSLVGHIATGTGAVARTVQTKLRDTVSVKDFGAVGDGVTNDTLAIQAAFNSGAVAIYFPAGRYIVTANLTRSGNTYIYGDTLTSSILQMNGTASFVYTGGTAGSEYGTNQLQIERLGFECPTVTAKSVINAAWTDGVGGTSKTFIMRDCQITGTNAAGGFGSAVLLTNARNIVVESVRILGDRDGTPLSSGFGFNIIGTNPTGAPVEMFFNKVQVYFVNTAFKIDGWIEGVFFTSCTMIACHIGINAVIGPAGPKPLINVIGCHINTDTFGIRTVGFVQSNYSDNLIYAQDVDGTSTGYAAISLNASGATLDVQVDNNNFQGIISGISKNGVVVEDGTGSDLCIISNNIFNSFDTAVWFQTGTTNALAQGNVFVSCATDILDQGTGSLINRFGDFAQTSTSGLAQVVSENKSSANNLTKTAGYGIRGRDTISTQKDVGAFRAVPQDADWVNATATIYGRNSDAVAGYAFFGINGTPEGVITAPIGAIATRRDGGASTTLYVKQSGTGNTGWVAK
jgi:hypothetical protein